MRAAGSPLALLAAAAAPLLVAAQAQPGPGLDQGQIALIVVGVIPIGLFIIFAIYKVLAIPCIPAPAPPAPTQRSLAATSKLTYEAYAASEADFNRPPTPTGRLSRTPSRSGSPEITNALMKALPTPAFRMSVEENSRARPSAPPPYVLALSL